jgi:hypothetical protein
MRGWQRTRPGRDGFDVAPEHLAVGRARACSLGSVASMRSMRRRQPQRPSGRGETARPRRRRMAPHGMRSCTWLEVVRRGEVVASFDLAVAPKLGRPVRLGRIVRGRIVRGRVVSGRGARATAEHAVRLGAQELRPAGADPSRGRPEPRAAQHGRDRGGRDADPQLQQLTLDAHIAPARVLPRQPPDQAARLGRKRWATGPATAAAPASLKHCPVPAAKRSRADRKAGPPLGREQPAHRSEQGPVDGRVPRPLPTAPEDRQLVAQHDDLKLPLTTTTGEHAHEAAQKSIQQTRQHDAQSEHARPRPPTRPSRPESNFFTPHGSRPAAPTAWRARWKRAPSPSSASRWQARIGPTP